jgi:hypothetical protein
MSSTVHLGEGRNLGGRMSILILDLATYVLWLSVGRHSPVPAIEKCAWGLSTSGDRGNALLLSGTR